MTSHLRRLVVAAALAGVVAGLLTAVLGRAGAPPSVRPANGVALLPRERGPLRTAPPTVRLPSAGSRPLPGVYPNIVGRDARIVARAPDPYGGPEWAVRTFRRANIRFLPGPRRVRAGTVECAQVGRMVRGRFVWIDPRRAEAIAVPVRTTDNTVCGGEGRAAVLGALRIPVGRPGASLPTVAATVVWGLSRRRGTEVRLRTREGESALPDVGQGTRLLVARGARALGRTTVLADGRPVRRGLDNQPFAGLVRDAKGQALRPAPFALDGLRVDAVVADPSSDRPQLLATAAWQGTRCWALETSLVLGEPVRVASRLGALVPDVAQCRELGGVPRGTWVSVGGGASSQGAQPTAERRRTRERRVMPGNATTVIAVPSDVVDLDVVGPTGVRTVRTVSVGRSRLAVLLSAGDLPVGPLAGLRADDGPRAAVYTGRDDRGREVRLRNGVPVGP